MRSMLAALAALALFAALAGTARAQPVALVTDLVGESQPAILSEIPAESRLKLRKDARLTVLYFASGHEYSFRGPALIRFRGDEPQVLEGARAERRALPVAQNGIKPGGVQPAAFVMRNPKPQPDAVRPAAGAPLSERVAFAVWLEQVGLKDEAARYWKALAAERPDSARLRALAGAK